MPLGLTKGIELLSEAKIPAIITIMNALCDAHGEETGDKNPYVRWTASHLYSRELYIHLTVPD